MAATEDAVIYDELAPQADDNHISRALLMVATVVVLGAIMSILDTTVVNVAIDTLAARLPHDAADDPVGCHRLHARAGHGDPAQRLGRHRFGTKRLYMGSIAMFVLGSCAVGPRLVGRRRSSCSASSRDSAAA